MRHTLNPKPDTGLRPDALAVVTSPDLVATDLSLRTYAWATLMSQRGLRVNQLRLAAMQSRGLLSGGATC